MQQHLNNFLVSFIDKRYKENWLAKLAQAKPSDNLVRGMDALYRELDERYCFELPNGNGQQDITFVRQALVKYNLKTCYVLSAYDDFNQRTMPVEEALNKIVGSSSTTIISFIPGIVAYFEGHSPGDRYICIRDL